jgi:uncharacterized membrane protein YhiD involved in acid resistance
MNNEIITALGSALNYGPYEILTNVLLATIFGLIISSVYKYTHKGLSYSQSFTLTIVFVTVIVAIVMMVIGSSLSRAFALVGALSIIRFRTVVKDTKDTSFVFAALAVGMAAGTSNYFLGIFATIFISILTVFLYKINFGAIYKSEFIMRFVFNQNFNSNHYLEIISKYSKRSNMLHIEPSGDGDYLSLTYDLNLRDGATAEDIASKMGNCDGVTEVTLIASKNDVDY